MSDFFSPGWSIYVAVVTLASLAGCLALLIVASRARTNPKDDTGHVWDGDLRELNNPMPRWWMMLFVITIVFGFGYLVLYPGLGSSKGLLGWSSAGQYRDEQAGADAQLSAVYAKYAATPAPELARDKAAMAMTMLVQGFLVAASGYSAKLAVQTPETINFWMKALLYTQPVGFLL